MNIKQYFPLPLLIHWINRKRLKNKDFSLFTSNCFGGIIYHNLGMKFLSPTINLRVDTSRDFYKMMMNLEHYMAQPVREYNDVDVSYPCGMLDDIKLHFNHYKDFNNAKNKWSDRIKRINFNNIYVIASDWVNDSECLSKSEVESFGKLPCKKVLVFTQNPYEDLPFTFYVGKEKLKNMLITNKITGLREFERYFDYVSWLNS